MGKKEKLGIGWIKGPCEPKKKKKKAAHVETKTGTVTWSRVALTARQSHRVPVYPPPRRQI